MKPAHVLIALVLVSLLAVTGAILLKKKNPAPSQQGAAPVSSVEREQIFTVRGRIISLDEHSGIVKIAHEEIPDYMPAMTMPFLTRDSNTLRKVKPGDDVVFKLAVTSDDSWITEIEKVSGASTVSAVPVSDEVEANRLKPGEKVPEFSFIDQDGRSRNSSEFSGRFVALTFIYTRCPLPNFCPLLNKKFAELQDRLKKEFPGKFHLLSVSIDPGYDTPKVLKRYASLHNNDESTWTFATGSPEQISHIAGLFGLTYDEKNPGLIDHDMRTALIAPDGRVIHVWKSNYWTPYEIRNRIDDTLSQKGLVVREP